MVGLADVVSFDAGAYPMLARRSDGSVWGWGFNGVGQVGNGTRGATPELSPVRVLAP